MASLYHYTSGKVLLGIIQSQYFWATDIRFLNDYEELNRGLDIFESFTKDLLKEIPSDREYLSELVRICVGNIRRNSKLTLINLVSFSTESDNLRQWMAYCNSVGGYCIEFDKDLIIPSYLDEYKNCLRLSEVEYLDSALPSDSSSIYKFGELIKDLTLAKDKQISEALFIESFTLKVNKLLLDSILLASSIKPSEFSDEREVRLLYIGRSKENETIPRSTDLSELYAKPNLPEVGFREVNDFLVPYQPLPFNIEAIKKIIIGPSSNMELAELGLKEFRDRNNLQFDVVHSKCTLRRL